jgi:hypothetical protein
LNAGSRKSGEKQMTGWTSVPLSHVELIRLRAKAHRRGVWYKALSRIEQALMNLAIRVVEKVRSRVLARSLTSVVEKLLHSMESQVAYLIRSVGCPLAERLSAIAQKWGNNSAKYWVQDRGFLQYLAVTQKNLSSLFRI